MNENLYELTKPQESILLTEKFYTNSNSISNIGGSLLFKEKVDFEVLEKAIHLFIQKNDIMKVNFKYIDDIPYQYIKNYVPSKLKTFHLKLKEELFDLEQKFINTNLNINESFLFEFRLIDFPDKTGGFNVTLHHIICDAWSMSLLINQITTLYFDLLNEFEISSTNYPSYIDYINQEKKYLTSSKFESDNYYWNETFNEEPSLVSFSSKNTSSNSQKANRFTFELKNNFEITQYCKQNNITVFTFLMTVFSLYLSKTNNIENIILGTPVLNRNGITQKNTMGTFINTLPMKIHINNSLDFITLATQVSINQFSMFRHHKYPLTEILKNVRRKYNISSNLYDTIISYQNARDNSQTSNIKYSTNWDFCGYISNSLDIHIYDMDDSGILKLLYDYQIEKFSESDIKNINKRINYIISQILSNQKILVSNINLLPDEEKYLLNSFNNTNINYDETNTIISLFEKQVSLTPNNIALKFNDSTLTYYELYEKVCKFANYLKEKNITKNIPILLLLDRSIEMIISMLATLKIGAYYIAIDPCWPKERIDFILQNSESNFLITSDIYVINYEAKINCILTNVIPHLVNSSILPNISTPEDLAYILYTSGSTGQPKGTLITNKNVVGLLNSTYNIFKQTNEDTWTLFHTYTFDFSTWEIYGALLYGSKLIIVPKEITTNPKEFINLIVNEKVTILNQTPAYFYKIIEQEKLSDFSSNDFHINYVILGGEAVQSKPLKYFKNKYPDITIYNGYGPTETTVFAIMDEISSEDIFNDDIYIGKPISNYQIHILDNNLNKLPIGVIGEICISGVGVCNGYFKKSELTEDKFIRTEKYGLIYKSGDIGYYCIDGRIKYIGRNDNQVKIRGFRIELDEIQKQILKCANVKKAIVIPINNLNFTKSLVAFFEASTPNITHTVLEEIKKNLTSYMIPKLYQVDDFPINNNGKIDINNLINTFHYKNSNTKIIEPRDDLEKDLLNILKTVTNISSISINTDFFDDLGFDSLNIMDFATKLTNYSIEIQDINNYTTIESLSKKIKENTSLDIFSDKLQLDIKISETPFSYDLTNVLLTGVTGFLGSHILYELLLNPTVSNIYCLIRTKNNTTIEKRFNKIINNYFSNFNIAQLIAQKVILIEGNFEDDNFGLDNSTYNDLKNNISTVIHCGANVRHYGKYKDFYLSNVKATKNIIQFCKDSSSSLAHISTVSVSGYCKYTDIITLSENDINLNQVFKNHVYMVTKYEAECEILKSIEKDNLNAKIFRLGNIMPRLKDGTFQINSHQNGFLSRIKTLIDIKSTTEEINSSEIDISPVDICANYIIKLMEHSDSQTIYHISNPNTLTIEDVLKNFGTTINIVNTIDCIELIKNLKNPLNAHLLNDLNTYPYKPIPFSTFITTQKLQKSGISWPKITDTYLSNLYNLILEI